MTEATWHVQKKSSFSFSSKNQYTEIWLFAKKRGHTICFPFFLFLSLQTTECEFYFVKDIGLKMFRDMLSFWHAVLVWKKCITGSFSRAECTANITHNECSVTEGTGQEHLLESFMTDQYIGNVASKGFSPL